MPDAIWVRQQAVLSLERLWPRLEAHFAQERAAMPEEWRAFEGRLRREWGRLFRLLFELYAGNYDFFYHLEQLLIATARSWIERPAWLKDLDARRMLC
jgi:hypothetical protein